MPQPVRGTQSLLGEDADRLAVVVDAFDRVRKLFGFKRVEVPVIEHTAVFARTMGETTDVVSKEMYSFEDYSGESITLRPEFTAGICRAFLSEGWQQFAPLRVATHGPAFRYERPQRGRYRQFNQLDAEIIGDGEPRADVELLSFANQLLRELGIKGVTLELNTLGDSESRSLWRAALVEYFTSFRSDISEDSQKRLIRNPLRILDSKDPRDQAVARDAPFIDEFLSSRALDFFQEVELGLKAENVRYRRNCRLVRGLDYYRHTAFEFTTNRLGSQGTVLAGGRYDGLIESLGGPHTPAVGWAAGIERLADLLPEDRRPLRTAALVIETDQEKLLNLGRLMLKELRRKGMPAQLVADGSINKRYGRALKLEADYVLVLSEPKLKEDVAQLRVRRRIADRYQTRGRVYSALKLLLQNQFGVEPDAYRKVVAHGGEIALKSQTS